MTRKLHVGAKVCKSLFFMTCVSPPVYAVKLAVALGHEITEKIQVLSRAPIATLGH
jgi:hypothetical protein